MSNYMKKLFVFLLCVGITIPASGFEKMKNAVKALFNRGRSVQQTPVHNHAVDQCDPDVVQKLKTIFEQTCDITAKYDLDELVQTCYKKKLQEAAKHLWPNSSDFCQKIKQNKLHTTALALCDYGIYAHNQLLAQQIVHNYINCLLDDVEHADMSVDELKTALLDVFSTKYNQPLRIIFGSGNDLDQLFLKNKCDVIEKLLDCCKVAPLPTNVLEKGDLILWPISLIDVCIQQSENPIAFAQVLSDKKVNLSKSQKAVTLVKNVIENKKWELALTMLKVCNVSLTVEFFDAVLAQDVKHSAQNALFYFLCDTIPFFNVDEIVEKCLKRNVFPWVIYLCGCGGKIVQPHVKFDKFLKNYCISVLVSLGYALEQPLVNRQNQILVTIDGKQFCADGSDDSVRAADAFNKCVTCHDAVFLKMLDHRVQGYDIVYLRETIAYLIRQNCSNKVLLYAKSAQSYLYDGWTAFNYKTCTGIWFASCLTSDNIRLIVDLYAYIPQDRARRVTQALERRAQCCGDTSARSVLAILERLKNCRNHLSFAQRNKLFTDTLFIVEN